MEKASIQTFIEDFFGASGIPVEKIEIVDDPIVAGARYMVYTEEPYLLIGKDGETLRAINHVFKKAMEKKFGFVKDD